MTTLDEADKKARLERAREAGLFRYSLVQELAEAGITAAERGRRASSQAGSSTCVPPQPAHRARRGRTATGTRPAVNTGRRDA